MTQLFYCRKLAVIGATARMTAVATSVAGRPSRCGHRSARLAIITQPFVEAFNHSRWRRNADRAQLRHVSRPACGRTPYLTTRVPACGPFARRESDRPRIFDVRAARRLTAAGRSGGSARRCVDESGCAGVLEPIGTGSTRTDQAQ